MNKLANRVLAAAKLVDDRFIISYNSRRHRHEIRLSDADWIVANTDGPTWCIWNGATMYLPIDLSSDSVITEQFKTTLAIALNRPWRNK